MTDLRAIVSACRMPNCQRKHLAKGLCSKHYSQVQRGIEPHDTPRTRNASKWAGNKSTKVYQAWRSIRNRCQPTSKSAKHYHQRGIRVCQRWDIFENFLTDMGEPPSSKHSIDRINNDGNYEPDNCRWATQVVQVRNTRWAHFDEETVREIRQQNASGITPKDLAVKFGSSPSYMARICNGSIWADLG